MLGPMLGPAAPAAALVSAILGMVSTILGEFLPKPPSLKDEITEVFNTFLAEAKLRKLGVAANQIWTLADTIQNHKENSTEYHPLNLQNGPEVTVLDDVWEYLLQDDKQTLPQWPKMLEKTLLLMGQLFDCVALEVTNPSTLAGVTQKTPITYLPSRMELWLGTLGKARPAAQNRGMVFHLSYNVGPIWVGDQIRQGINTKLAASASAASVAVSQKQAGSADRDYHVFLIQNGGLHHWKLISPYKNSGDGNHVRSYRLHDGTQRNENFGALTDVWGMVGGDEGLDNAPHSIQSEKGRDRLYFYTADGQGAINGYVQDELGVVWKTYGRSANRPLSMVRAVQNPEPVLNDPDPAAALQDIDYIVYGGTDNFGHIYVDSRRSPQGKTRILKEGWVPGPWGGNSYTGASVDKHYLWIHAPLSFACATHASVMRCLEGTIASPRWAHGDPVFLKNKKLGNLCSCDDGTILASLTEGNVEGGLGWPLYTTAYDVDLKKQSIAVDFFSIPNGASSYRNNKVRLSCWPLFEAMTEYLEKRVGHSDHIPH